MSNPADANVTNPKTFFVTPGAAVTGAPVDDLEIDVGLSDINNTKPASFPITTVVPKADVVVQSDGTWHVPFSDGVKQMLADGTYAARSEAISGAKVSGPSPLVFFNIVSPPPSAPTAFTVA